MRGAVAVAAAALWWIADPRAGSAPGTRSHAATTSVAPERVTPPRVMIAPAANLPSPSLSLAPLPSPWPRRVRAEDLDRALLATDAGKQDLVLDRLLTAWVSSDPQAAARYSELLADPFLREVGQRTVALRWAEIDREAAAQWAAALGDQVERGKAIGAVAQSLGDTDPRGALALIARYGGVLSETSRIGVLTRWADRDFEAAQAWLEAQPPGRARDAMVERLTFQRAQSDPPAAADFASRLIGDAGTLREALISILQPWVHLDADAARSWAASTDGETRRRIDAELALDARDASQ
jgi:hypothetical protein